jgi:DNA-directed RNA polymerase beta subunit
LVFSNPIKQTSNKVETKSPGTGGAGDMTKKGEKEVTGGYKNQTNTNSKSRVSNSSQFLATELIWKKCNPGRWGSDTAYWTFLYTKFFNPKKYSIGSVGRLRLNKRFGRVPHTERRQGAPSLNCQIPTLTPEDILLALDYLIELAGGGLSSGKQQNLLESNTKQDFENLKPILKSIKQTASPNFSSFYFLDDIDHLKNRRVRLPGEIIQNQFRLALNRVLNGPFPNLTGTGNGSEGMLETQTTSPRLVTPEPIKGLDSAQAKSRLHTTLLKKMHPQTKLRPHSFFNKVVGGGVEGPPAPRDKVSNPGGAGGTLNQSGADWPNTNKSSAFPGVTASPMGAAFYSQIFGGSPPQAFVSTLRELFNTSQLSQYMDQTNPLAEITHKRRLSSLGPGGVGRDQAGFAVREIHPSHFGRICPIETPEGQNAGLVGSLASYARINQDGFLQSPARLCRTISQNFHAVPGRSHLPPTTLLKKNGGALLDSIPPRTPLRGGRGAGGQGRGLFFNKEWGPGEEVSNRNLTKINSEVKEDISYLFSSEVEDLISLCTADIGQIIDSIDLFQDQAGNRSLNQPKYNLNRINLKLEKPIKLTTRDKILYPSRYKQEFSPRNKERIQFQGISPVQLISVATSLIPFLEHDDANRALMGSNMQRQAVPLMIQEKPFVGTGLEIQAARDSSSLLIAPSSGQISYVDAKNLSLKIFKSSQRSVTKSLRGLLYQFVTPRIGTTTRPPIKKVQGSRGIRNGGLNFRNLKFDLSFYLRSNQGTMIRQRPSVQMGEWVEKGELLADGSATKDGEIALGKNVLLAYMPWEGYNFEDAIVINERLVSEDIYSSIHIDRYEMDIKNLNWLPSLNNLSTFVPAVGKEYLTKNPLFWSNPKPPFFFNKVVGGQRTRDSREASKTGLTGANRITSDFGFLKQRINESSETISASIENDLDQEGIIKIGTWVQEGDILIGKITPIDGKRSSDSVLQRVTTGSNVFTERLDWGQPSSPAPGLETESPIKQEVATETKSLVSDTKDTHVSSLHKQSNNLEGNNDKVRDLIESPKSRELFEKSQKTKISNSIGNPKSRDSPPEYKLLLAIFTGIGVARNSERERQGDRVSQKFEFNQPPPGVTLSPDSLLTGGQGGTPQAEVTKSPLQGGPEINLPVLNELPEKFTIYDRSRSGSSNLHFKNSSLKVGIGIRGRIIDCIVPWREGLDDNRKTKNISELLNTKGKSDNLVKTSGDTIAERPLVQKTKRNEAVLATNTSLTRRNILGSIQIFIAHKKRIQLGDKMSGRHGNKGIVSLILPPQDMPYLQDGTPVDVVLNPLGVPSRMNVGQVLETLFGLASKYLHQTYRLMPFDEMYQFQSSNTVYGPDTASSSPLPFFNKEGGRIEVSRNLVYSYLRQAKKAGGPGGEWLFDPNNPGKTQIFDGRTGEIYHQPVLVGYSYMFKLIHLVDDKIHARSTGPYSLVTQQPLGGRSKKGGQRLGEMEVWALEGFGAASILQEFLTIKSDEIYSRNSFLFNLMRRGGRGGPPPYPPPPCFKVPPGGTPLPPSEKGSRKKGGTPP